MEVLTKEGITNIRLTLTPTRYTLKFPVYPFSYEERMVCINEAERFYKMYQNLGATKTLRLVYKLELERFVTDGGSNFKRAKEIGLTEVLLHYGEEDKTNE
jgi:hypothetical protein